MIKRLILTVFLLGWTGLLFAADAFKFEESAPQTVSLQENGAPVWDYVFDQKLHSWADPDDPRRFSGSYFHPLYGFGGESLTLNGSNWDGHTHHHALWSSFTTVDVLRGEERIHYDTWTDNTPLKKHFIEWGDRKEVPEGWVFNLKSGWFIEQENGEKEELAEEVLESLTSPVSIDSEAGKVRTIDLTFRWTSLRERVELAGDRPVSKDFAGMQVRFAYPAVPPKIFTRETEYKEDLDVGSSASPWIAYESDFAADGRKMLAEHPDYVRDAAFPVLDESKGKPTSGAAVFSHPDNPKFDGGWAVRFYGMVTTGWPGLAGEVMEPGVTYTLKYRLLIYEKPLTPETLDRFYGDYAAGCRQETSN